MSPTWTGFFPPSDVPASGRPTREHGRPLVPLDDPRVRWADVAPFLALRVEEVELDARDQTRPLEITRD